MQRRGFLGLVAAIVGLRRLNATTIGLPEYVPTCACDVRTYGYLTPTIVIATGYDNGSARVFFNGVDITHERGRFGPILAADDQAGFIEIFARNAAGHHFSGSDGRLVRSRVYGHVRVSMRRHGAAS